MRRLKYGTTVGLFGLVVFCTQQASAAVKDACCTTSDGTCRNVNPFCTGCNSPEVCDSSMACSSTVSYCATSIGCTDVNDSCVIQACGFVGFNKCRHEITGVCSRVTSSCNSLCAGPTNKCILYVDETATGADDGTTWADAYPTLQDALDGARTLGADIVSYEMWVAEGTYYPDEGGGESADDRDASFVMVDGLEMYGGFAGDEEVRTPTGDPTILSGDLKQDDDTPLIIEECNSSSYEANGWDTASDPDVCLYVHDVREIYADAESSSQGLCESLNGGEWNGTRDTRCYYVSRQCSGGTAPGTSCKGPGDCAGSGTCVANIEQIKNADNSIHVVTVDETMTNVVIDGFTITAGNANRKACVDGTNDGTICIDDTPCTGGGSCSKACVGGVKDGDACAVDTDCGACVGGANDGEDCENAGDCASPGICPLRQCLYDLLGSQGSGIINRDMNGPATAINNDLTVRDCIFDANFSRNHGAFNDHGTDTIIDDCIFKYNVTGTRGGGLYTHKDSDATVTNCTFSNNYSGFRGGGMYIASDATTASAVSVSDCLFENNVAFGLSGGLNAAAGSVVTVSDCEFRGNSVIAPGSGGAGIWTEENTIDVTDCVFERNNGVLSGAVRLPFSDSTFTRCQFLNNEASGALSVAGAMELVRAQCTIDDCDFIENKAVAHGAVYLVGGSLTATNSHFVRNTSTSGNGGALYVLESVLATFADLTNCTFVDNDALDGGAVYTLFSDLDAVNCLFVRNETSANGFGGAIYAALSTGSVVNSTIAANVASGTGKGGGIYSFSTLTVDNSILWGNAGAGDDESSQLDDASGTATVTYTDWQGHTPETSNINSNPEFIDVVETGTWTAATYDSATGKTTFTGSGLTASPLVDFILQPDTSAEDYTIITANTTTTITAWGDFSTICIPSCPSFDIVDYRLDDASSPCIDTGDNDALPADAQDLDGDTNTTEPIPYDLDNATRVIAGDVDMGCYEDQ